MSSTNNTLAQARFAQAWEPDPSTPNEWLMHWFREKRIRVPTQKLGVTNLEIDNISTTNIRTNPRPDALITTKTGKSFYVLFTESRVYRPYDKPTLVIPNCCLNRAWWLLNE